MSDICAFEQELAAANLMEDDLALLHQEWNLRLRYTVSNPGWTLGGVTMLRNTMRAAVTAVCLIGMTSLASLAASPFEGVWKVKDTAGRPFEITLSSDGVAKATRGEGMTTLLPHQQTFKVRRPFPWCSGVVCDLLAGCLRLAAQRLMTIA